jgi:hypothetical protein
MQIKHLKTGENFFITNQYKAGEFEYLGNLTARHKQSNQVVNFNGHTIINKILIGEYEENPLLLTKI